MSGYVRPSGIGHCWNMGELRCTTVNETITETTIGRSGQSRARRLDGRSSALNVAWTVDTLNRPNYPASSPRRLSGRLSLFDGAHSTP